MKKQAEGIITVFNISKTFLFTGKHMKFIFPENRKKVALMKLSFSVNEGEIFGLLGPNGAGKTTAMRIISTLIKCDSGDVFVAGESVNKSPYAIRRIIGFLSGDLKLEEFFTPTYLFDFFSSIRDVPQKQIKERRESLFERFDINEYANEKISVLSNGMKQKVSLVLSIVHNPDIIIFDEPTNGLDILAAKAVTDFLLELKKQGKTIILATHIFSLAEKLCDRVGFIIDGQIISSFSLTAVSSPVNLEESFFLTYNQLSDRRNQ